MTDWPKPPLGQLYRTVALLPCSLRTLRVHGSRLCSHSARIIGSGRQTRRAPLPVALRLMSHNPGRAVSGESRDGAAPSNAHAPAASPNSNQSLLITLP